MLLYMLMPAVVFIPVGIYLYHFFKRFLSLFGLDDSRKITKVLSVIFPVLCALAGWRIYDIGAVIVLHFVICCVLAELINLVLKRIHLSNRVQKVWSFVYRSGVISVLIIAVLMGYGYVNMHNVRETKYAFTSTKKLDHNLRIAQISDLHMGTTMDVEKIHEYCNKIEQEKPDMLVLTGDIFDERTTKQDMEQTVRILAGITTTYGTYYIWGNHDPNQYSSSANYQMDELRDELKTHGITVLEDKAVAVNSQITVVGRVDEVVNAERLSTAALLDDVDPNSYIILLDHRPVEFEDNAAAGVDLQLSGHTHAGQIWPTGQLGELLGANDLNYGVSTIGNYHAVVSSGIAGWGYAIRTGGHSEYVIVDIKK